MGESTEGDSAGSGQSRPTTITIPPRAPFETLFAVGSTPGFSPGPMTLMSSFFAGDSDGCSFSQLLAGAMASPLAKPSLLSDYSVKDADSEKLSGYKQKQPMSLLVAQSPLFMVSPRFSPSGLLNSPGFLSPLQSPFGMSHQQALAHVTAQAAINQSYKQMQAEYQHSSSAEPVVHQLPNQPLQCEATNVPLETESLKVETSELSQFDSKVTSGAIEKPASDGYNWRKYGQKLVKGSECPRSYYKCTHPDCNVRKKVERSPDGRVIEITYKGKHNHELPKSNKRKQDDCDQESRDDNVQARPRSASHGWTEMNRSNKAVDSQPENVSNKQLSEQLAVACKRDEMEVTAIVLDEKDGDETNAERRSSEVGSSVLPSSHKTVMEPKIIVQTRSEVDLLDDGYKWRKYGQKVVKGNTNPRSYYRCTYKGCNVRKHVERASADPKAVITTYEGKHNHDTPTAPKTQS